jgi:hypothetical protein
MTIKTLNAIKDEVKEWSYGNFGNQVSKRHYGMMRFDAPLMGIVEELGEYMDATSKELEIDALCDIVVYLTDFMWRRAEFDNTEYTYDGLSVACTLNSVISSVGWLMHISLKEHQGIRPMEREVVIRDTKDCIRDIYTWCHQELAKRGENPIKIINEVWNEVMLRNWKQNNVDGVACQPTPSV